MVREAAAIRSEADEVQLESALERAWVLGCDFERLPPTMKVGMDRSGEALVAVRVLVAAGTAADLELAAVSAPPPPRSSASRPPLAEPTSVGFRRVAGWVGRRPVRRRKPGPNG